MRQSTVVNHENEDLMNGIKRQLVSIYGAGVNPYMTATFVGVLLVLKKNNLLTINDCIDPHHAFDRIEGSDMPDEIIRISLDTIANVLNTVNITSLEAILHQIALAEFNEGEYLLWYDYFTNELFTKNRTFGQFIAPENFATLVDAFLPSETKSIYNPFGGMMRFATDMERYESMDAGELNKDVWTLGMLRLELSYNAEKVNFKIANVDSWTPNLYDAIVAMPPLAGNICMHSPSPLSVEPKREDIELVVPSRFAESTTANGCCITFVAPSIMWGTGDKSCFREWATKNKYIDTIILLPKNLLENTNISVVCLVLRKNSLHMDGIRMIDASECFINHRYKNNLSIGQIMEAYHQDKEKVSATVSFEQIADNDYSWNIADYLGQTEIECPEGYTVSRIEDLITFPDVKRSTDIHSGKVVQVSDLSDDWTHPYVDVDSIEHKDFRRGCAMVTQDAVLLSTIRSLKPSIVKASEDNPVFVNQNVLVVIPNKNIDAEYLCMALAKTELQGVGIAAPHISKTRLLRQQIAYPSVEQQRSTYKEARSAAMREQVKSLHLEEVFEEMKSEYMNEIRSRKHDMKPHLRQLASACDNLDYYITHKDRFSDKEFMDGMKEEVANQKVAIESLATLLKIFSREERFGNPEVINIDRYLSENYTDGENYTVDHDTDYDALKDYGLDVPEWSFNLDLLKGKIGLGFKVSKDDEYAEGANIKIAKDDLQRLCDNIINNAIQHGFTDPERSDYSIWSYLTIDKERNMFQIDFTNNGTPLPKGLDKLRYGLRGEKAGVTGGTGEGGYIVKSIVEHYKGDYDIFTEETENSTLTTVRILLPIHRNDE